jgi:hypothetical protein
MVCRMSGALISMIGVVVRQQFSKFYTLAPSYKFIVAGANLIHQS